jgi:hypothetical protein
LGIYPKEHATAQEIRWNLPRRWWKAATKFSIVRNPWDKAVSHYEYRVKYNAQGLGDRHLSFPVWVRLTYGDQAPPYYDKPKMFMPQVNWLRIHGRLCTDAVLRFETLSQDFHNLARQLTLDCELPHLNATKRRPYREYYSTEAVDVIGTWFRDDIAEFGYTFEKRRGPSS